MPVAAPTAVALPLRARSSSVQTRRAAEGARRVFTNARAAAPFAASALPALKPNQPNQSRPAPRTVNATLWGRNAWRA
jgi:hypothetical protein